MKIHLLLKELKQCLEKPKNTQLTPKNNALHF